MKRLSKIYKELGIAFTYPISIKDADGNETYFEYSNGFCYRKEYDADGNQTYQDDSYDYSWIKEYDADGNETYFKDSDDYWWRREYDADGNRTYFEDSDGYTEGTKRSSCNGKVIEVDGKKYQLKEIL